MDKLAQYVECPGNFWPQNLEPVDLFVGVFQIVLVVKLCWLTKSKGVVRCFLCYPLHWSSFIRYTINCSFKRCLVTLVFCCFRWKIPKQFSTATPKPPFRAGLYNFSNFNIFDRVSYNWWNRPLIWGNAERASGAVSSVSSLAPTPASSVSSPSVLASRRLSTQTWSSLDPRTSHTHTHTHAHTHTHTAELGGQR